jgi:selenocysteine-specific elongation factor
MHVVVTAGHVDHGKSTLVRALTGRDPDRLEEERRRGLSIELGYCWTELPRVGEVAFVDVPGHQRFITTALAGMGPVPVALLVVAADDPWMPQTAEHLRALDALGVAHGIVVVTRSDLADPAPAISRAAEEVSRTTLAGAATLAVSGLTGDGLGHLREALAGLLADLPEPDPDADVRLWIDRSFHVRGAGTVVTGTLPRGTIAVGDELELGTDLVRVRGLESLGRARDRVSGVARVAVDLGGRGQGAVRRGGAMLTPGAFLGSEVVDVRVRGEERLPARPVLHLGSHHAAVHVRPLGPGLVRLTLPGPLPLRVLDRALLRDPGTGCIWGVEVLDPDPPVLSRRGAAARRADELATYDGSTAATLRLRGIVRETELRRLGVPGGPPPAGTVRAGPWLVESSVATRLRDQLAALVVERSTATRPGVSEAAAARALGLPDPGILSALVAEPLRVAGGRVVDDRDRLAPELDEATAALRRHLATEPFAAPAADELRAMGLGRAEVAALHRAGAVLRVAEGVVLLPDAAEQAVARLAGLDQPFTVSEARSALGTSRRVALPLLAHLDATGRSVRLSDDTRRLR